MQITFLEMEPWEKRYIRKKLGAHQLRFYAGPLEAGKARQIVETEVLSPFIYSTINHEVLDALPHLRLIATRSTGYDHIDVRECRRRGIAVCNVPLYAENTVAEHTFALILALSRNLQKAIVKRLTDDYSAEGLRGFDLKGKILGVVGTGRIGLHVVRIARGFDMQVLASDNHPSSLLSEVLGFTYVSLEVLLAKSHIVTLHVPYNEQTHHLFDRSRFEQMRQGAYLVNTARGAIVDTEAMIEALDGKLGGAALDVLEGEELIKEETAVLSQANKLETLASIGKNDILLRKPNVIYTPHVAFNSQEAVERILETTVRNIAGFVAGGSCCAV